MGVAIVSITILFVLLWRGLPMEIDGLRPGNIFMQIFYVGFISVTISMVLIFCLIIGTRREYVKKQIDTISHFRHLLLLMVKRDFVTRYRRSVLGVLWSVLNPLLTMIVLAMVFSLIFSHDIPNFPIYLFSGQLIYNFYAEATSTAMTSVSSNAGIIKKLYVPRYIFPMSKVISSTVNLGFSFFAFLLVFVATQETFKLTMLLIPVPILYVFVFSLGVGMILSSMAVFFRDITYIYGVLITLLMFLTPIMYPVSILPDRVFHIIHLNPMFHYVSYFRDLTLYGNIPGLWTNIICLGFSIFALGAGVYVKMSQQDKYILYL